jgi:hypothetical protein
MWIAKKKVSSWQKSLVAFMPQLRAMIRDNGLLLVSERKLRSEPCCVRGAVKGETE